MTAAWLQRNTLPSELSSSIFIWVWDLKQQKQKMHRATNGYFFTAAVTTKFEYGETVRNSENLKTGLMFQE